MHSFGHPRKIDYSLFMGRGQGQDIPFAVVRQQPNKLDVLLVEDDMYLSESAMAWLTEVAEVDARLAGSIKEAESEIAKKQPDVILSDNGLPDGKGLQFLLVYKAFNPQTLCLLWSGALSREEEAEAAPLDGCYSKGLRVFDEIRSQLDARKLKQ